ncbi:MAG: hypothetical protein O3B92_03305 [Actinobacteria bacterium]|nr:hypothetical protein [Actinomycetota bacterium]
MEDTQMFISEWARTANKFMGFSVATGFVGAAHLAIIVFGDVVNASDEIKLLLAVAVVGTALAGFNFAYGAIDGHKAWSKGLTAAEAATPQGKSLQKQPWGFYVLFSAAFSFVPAVVALRAIYA